jgi:arabinose-5-phosphate isomerase
MVIEQVKEVLKIEAEAILDLLERVGPEFEKAVQMILEAKGRVILTGMGKSGLVGRKISSTLSSTGTPSIFLHPGEAIHGDLGMVTREDVVLAISNSGHTQEIKNIIPILKDMGTKIITFTGGLDSPMALESDAVIDVGVEREPTASTTAALAMGDALAVVLINCRRFSSKDFQKFHPGGSLGERLTVPIKEVMFTGDNIPVVVLGSKVSKAVKVMDSKGLGATLVVDNSNSLVGIVTDGDLRRALTKPGNVREMKVEEIMSPSPKTIAEDQSAAEALGIMELYEITHLCIVDRKKRVNGVVHLHDLLGREEFRLNEGFGPSSGTNNRSDHSA